jgi:Holliday junction resolvasome RuvABC endonuclease subunit
MPIKPAVTPKPIYKRILGIDSSTTGVAWTLVSSGKPLKWGKIDLTKYKTMEDRLRVIGEEYPKLLKELKPDYVYVEQTIYMRNVATMRVLSYIVGALICATSQQGIGITDITPMTAKSYYGYLTLNRKFVAAAKKKLGKLAGEKLCASMRKSQIQRVNMYNFPKFEAADHDISDSCSIAMYGYSQKVKPITIKTGREILLDLEELKKLGLDGLI